LKVFQEFTRKAGVSKAYEMMRFLFLSFWTSKSQLLV